MRTAAEAPRTRLIGSRRRRLAPTAPAPDPRALAGRIDVHEDDLTERVQLVEFEWPGGHGVQPMVLLSKRLLD